MASKADRMYYENFVQAADYCCKAADYLVDCMVNYDSSRLGDMIKTMHGFEHAADIKKHEMAAALVKAFVTPLDREDMAALSQDVDEVADKVEEVMQRFYIDHIKVVPQECVDFARKVAHCCVLMRTMLQELENFKKADKLRKLIIEVSDAEEECDRLYLEVMHKARTQYEDVLDVIAWRTIYDYMEGCADACSHVADLVETIVMKNT